MAVMSPLTDLKSISADNQSVVKKNKRRAVNEILTALLFHFLFLFTDDS